MKNASEKTTQVSFVINDDLYSQYKIILANERTRVTTDLVRYISERVAENLDIDKDLLTEYRRIMNFKGKDVNQELSTYIKQVIDDNK